MRIITEGPDGSGKTFLVKQLSKDLGMKTFWSAGPPGSIFKVEQCCIDQYNMDNIVFDRVTCISEQCYNINISIIRRQLLNYYLLKMTQNSIIIYCTALAKESEDGLRNEKHDKMVRDNFEEIKLRYKNIMLNIMNIQYNFQTSSYEDLLWRINNMLHNTTSMNF